MAFYDWKSVLRQTFLKLGLIKEDWTGKTEINWNEGHICDLKRQETLKKRTIDAETGELSDENKAQP